MARRNTPYNYSPYGDAPREKDTFFTPSVYERVGIALVEVYLWVGKLVISVCKMNRGYRKILWLWKVENI